MFGFREFKQFIIIFNIFYYFNMWLKLFHTIYLIILLFGISNCDQQNQSKESEGQNIQPISSDIFPKIVWQYWRQGEDALSFSLRLTIYRNKRMLEAQGWEYNLLDNKSLPKYIQPPKINFKKIYMQIHEADWIRLRLLQNYGGVWMDINIVVLESLDFLFHLKQNKKVVNKLGERPLVYGSYMDSYGTKQTDIDIYGNTVRLSPGLQISFLATVKNASLIRETRLQLQTFYNDSEGVVKSIGKTLLIENIKLGDENCTYLATNTAIQTCLQRKQHQLDAQFTGKNKNRKYAVEEYGLWCADNFHGNYQLQYYSSFTPEQTYAFMSSANLDDLQYPLWGQIGARRQTCDWQQAFLSQFYENAPKISQIGYDKRIFKWLSNYICPEQFTIHNNSFIDRYILNESQTINKKYGLRKDKMQIKDILQEMEFCHPTFFGWSILAFFYFQTQILALLTCLLCILVGWKVLLHFSAKKQIDNQIKKSKKQMEYRNVNDNQQDD